MINKYTASCFRCRQLVQAGTGQTNKIGEKWKTEHKVCPDLLPPIYSPSFGCYDDDDEVYQMKECDFDPDIGDR